MYTSPNCQLYEGINIKDNESVAMKFEKRRGKDNELESEAYYLIYLKGFGIPKIITYGKSGAFNVLIEELLGPSLHSLWKLRKNKYEKKLLKDICMIALQGLDRLEYIHSKYIIHRDIKPYNFLIGKKEPKIIYLIDFGYAHKYRSSRTGKHIKFKNTNMIWGSFNYLSINGNKGYELSRRDDLESFGYMLIYLATNYLPWMKFEKSKLDEGILIKEIYKLKKSTTPEQLCKNLPEEFLEYVKYVRNLEFEQNPDYYYMKSLFISILTKNKLKNDILFSWVLNKTKIIKKSNTEEKIVNLMKRKESTQKRLYIKIKESLEKEKNISKNILTDFSLKKINNLNNKPINKAESNYENNNINIINNFEIININKIEDNPNKYNKKRNNNINNDKFLKDNDYLYYNINYIPKFPNKQMKISNNKSNNFSRNLLCQNFKKLNNFKSDIINNNIFSYIKTCKKNCHNFLNLPERKKIEEKYIYHNQKNISKEKINKLNYLTQNNSPKIINQNKNSQRIIKNNNIFLFNSLLSINNNLENTSNKINSINIQKIKLKQNAVKMPNNILIK